MWTAGDIVGLIMMFSLFVILPLSILYIYKLHPMISKARRVKRLDDYAHQLRMEQEKTKQWEAQRQIVERNL